MNDTERLRALNDIRARLGLPLLTEMGRDPRAVRKLNLAEQCEILAFALCKVPTTIIAAVFDVTNGTVLRLRSSGTTPGKYPKVVEKLMEFNTNRDFCDAYITEDKEKAIRDLYPEFRRIGA